MTKEELKILETSMTPDEIMEIAKRMCPIMRNSSDGNMLYWIEPLEIHGESCTYSPVYIRRVTEPIQFIREIESYHKYGGYYGFIRPSVDEAIYQCPKDILDKVVAFEFVIPEDLSIYNIYVDELDRHKLSIRYYTGFKLPDDLKRDIIWA
jgi:hypothetical protein